MHHIELTLDDELEIVHAKCQNKLLPAFVRDVREYGKGGTIYVPRKFKDQKVVVIVLKDLD